MALPRPECPLSTHLRARFAHFEIFRVWTEWPDYTALRDPRSKAVCTKCGMIGADARELGMNAPGKRAAYSGDSDERNRLR